MIRLLLKELLHFKLYGKEPDARYFPEDWKKNEFDSSHRREKRSTPSSPAQFSTSYSIGVHKEVILQNIENTVVEYLLSSIKFEKYTTAAKV